MEEGAHGSGHPVPHAAPYLQGELRQLPTLARVRNQSNITVSAALRRSMPLVNAPLMLVTGTSCWGCGRRTFQNQRCSSRTNQDSVSGIVFEQLPRCAVPATFCIQLLCAKQTGQLQGAGVRATLLRIHRQEGSVALFRLGSPALLLFS